MTAAIKPSYRRTEAKYKGGAHEMYVTYDLEQRTRGAKTAVYPKIKRVYIRRGQGLGGRRLSEEDRSVYFPEPPPRRPHPRGRSPAALTTMAASSNLARRSTEEFVATRPREIQHISPTNRTISDSWG
jgi:hypothetical protein